MLYFIPGWYADGAWHEQEQYWYARRMHTEFDDTVKHIQLFHRNRICPFQIALLSFAPNFRHFLHRQGVYHAPYWSCFDAIQGIERKKMALLSYHNLKWPEGTEFVYSMFAVLAMRGGEKYAKVEFGEDGNPIQIELYEQGQTVRKNIYDDRGFVSSTIVYREGKPSHQDYLGEDGVWRIRLFYSDGRVLVNPRCGSFRMEQNGQVAMIPFQKERYADLEELIREVLAAFVVGTGEGDVFCAAAHPIHMPMLRERLQNRHLVFSLFEERNDFHLKEEDIQMLSAAGHLICDSTQGKAVLEEYGQGRLPACTVITPFDTRPDFGISQQMHSQKILVPVDELDPAVFDELVRALGSYLLENRDAQVYLFTRRATYSLDKTLLENARNILQKAGFVWQDAPAEPLDLTEEGEQPDDRNMAGRWFAKQCVDELSVTKCLRMQRLVVDFRTVRDVYLRVIAISMGLPQILRRPSEFVVSGENGVVLEDTAQLSHCLTYYLAELANWNKAMVAAYELGKRFDTANQVQRWKGVLNSFEPHSSAVSGNG